MCETVFSWAGSMTRDYLDRLRSSRADVYNAIPREMPDSGQ